MADNTLLLKIFSGPHVGAEVLLGVGEHVIGGDDSCDVILNDQFITSRHAQITIDGSSVRCAGLEGKVFVDGQQIEDAELDAFQYFALGNTYLAIGPADAKWPVREFPEFRLDVPTADPEEESNAEEEVEHPEEEAVAAEARLAGSAWSRRRFIVAAVAAAVLLLNAAAGYLVLGGSLFGVVTGSDDSALEAELQSIIHSYAPGQTVKLSRWREGFHADGDVLTIEQHEQLEENLRKTDPDVSVCVYATERLAESVQDVLRAIEFEGGLIVSYPEPGRVLVAGEMTDLAPWRAAKSRIEQDVPLQELIDTVTLPKPGGPTRTPARAEGVSKKNRTAGRGQVRLVRHEPVPAITPTHPNLAARKPTSSAPAVREPDSLATTSASPTRRPARPTNRRRSDVQEPSTQVTVSTTPTASDKPESAAESAGVTERESQPTTVVQSVVLTADDPPIVLPIQSVHIGATRSIILQDGPRGERGAQLSEGALLANNYRLKKIERDKLVVSLNGRDRWILLRGKKP